MLLIGTNHRYQSRYGYHSQPSHSAAPERGQLKGIKMKDTNYAADFVDLFMKGVERAAELQKKALEAATQQTAEAIAASKKAIQPSVPEVFDVIQQGFERYVEAQKGVIDLVVQQTAAMVETTKHGGSSVQKVVDDFTKSVQQSVERAVEIEKKALGLAEHSAKAASGATKHKG